MGGPLIVCAEGVLLVRHRNFYGSSRPIDDGMELIHQLKQPPTTRTVVLVDTRDPSAAEQFLMMNGLSDFTVAGLDPADAALPRAQAQWEAIKRERGKGPINLVVTSDPDLYETCLAEYQTVVLFGRRGRFSGAVPLEPWSAMIERIDRQREAEVRGQQRTA